MSYQLVQEGPSPKVQVLPANQIEPDSASLEDEDKDKFKCLYLLVETAVAVRQREKEQEPACWVFSFVVLRVVLIPLVEIKKSLTAKAPRIPKLR